MLISKILYATGARYIVFENLYRYGTFPPDLGELINQITGKIMVFGIPVDIFRFSELIIPLSRKFKPFNRFPCNFQRRGKIIHLAFLVVHTHFLQSVPVPIFHTQCLQMSGIRLVNPSRLPIIRTIVIQNTFPGFQIRSNIISITPGILMGGPEIYRSRQVVAQINIVVQ